MEEIGRWECGDQYGGMRCDQGDAYSWKVHLKNGNSKGINIQGWIDAHVARLRKENCLGENTILFAHCANKHSAYSWELHSR